MSVKSNEKIYALYKGEEFISVGTITEISAEIGKSIESLKHMTFPTYKRRVKNNALQMYLLEDDDEVEHGK